jgi:hypothetical protein
LEKPIIDYNATELIQYKNMDTYKFRACKDDPTISHTNSKKKDYSNKQQRWFLSLRKDFNADAVEGRMDDNKGVSDVGDDSGDDSRVDS